MNFYELGWHGSTVNSTICPFASSSVITENTLPSEQRLNRYPADIVVRQVFLPYTPRKLSSENSRSRPGSGLGLSLVAAVARLHGGSIRLEDNAPGLRAVLTLPARTLGTAAHHVS